MEALSDYFRYEACNQPNCAVSSLYFVDGAGNVELNSVGGLLNQVCDNFLINLFTKCSKDCTDNGGRKACIDAFQFDFNSPCLLGLPLSGVTCKGTGVPPCFLDYSNFQSSSDIGNE